MDRYYFKDYDEYLLYESGLNNDGKEVWQCKVLEESKGIVDDYNRIIDEIFEEIAFSHPIPFNNEECYLQYRLENYKMKQDCFIESLSVRVNTNSNEKESYFEGGRCELIKDGTKLKKCLFNICINEKTLNTENAQKEFYLIMSHELQHAYRFLNICLTNQAYVDNENNKKEIYQRSILNGDEKYIERNVKTLYYLSRRDEIMSEVNKLFEYIRQNKEINYFNYKEHEHEFPLYTLIQNLEESAKTFDVYIKNRGEYEMLINVIGETFNKIIGEDISPSVGFVKFRNKVISAAMFANRKYKRTLAYAFKEFKRYPVGENLNVFKKIITWDMKEIEKELRENKDMNKILGRI